LQGLRCRTHEHEYEDSDCSKDGNDQDDYPGGRADVVGWLVAEHEIMVRRRREGVKGRQKREDGISNCRLQITE
jgi:hypothetical protein